MPTTLHDEAVIAGIGQTAYSKNSGVSELALATEAVRNAIEDAGIAPCEVDGLVTYTMDSSDEVEVARTVGIGDMTFWSQVNYGGGAAVGLVDIEQVICIGRCDLECQLDGIGRHDAGEGRFVKYARAVRFPEAVLQHVRRCVRGAEG